MIDRKLVLEWAKKVGLAIDSPYLEPHALDAYVSLCELAQAEERERCAKIVEPTNDREDWTEYAYMCSEIAKQIRDGSRHERGNQ